MVKAAGRRPPRVRSRVSVSRNIHLYKAGKETPLPTQSDAPKASVAPTDPAQPLDIPSSLVPDSSSSTDLKPPSPSLNSPSPKALQHSSTSPPTSATTTEAQGGPSGAHDGTVTLAIETSESAASISNSKADVPIENGRGADVEMKDVGPEN